MTEELFFTLLIAGFGAFIGLLAFLLSLYNTYKQHYGRGPEFNLVEARAGDRGGSQITVKVLIQNIGDRLGYMRWEEIVIAGLDNLIPVNSPEEFEWHGEAMNTKIAEFNFTVRSNQSLHGAFLSLKGFYSSHRGKGLIKHDWSIPLTGDLGGSNLPE